MKHIGLIMIGALFAGGAYADAMDSGCELEGQIYSIGILAPQNLKELTDLEERGEPVNDDGNPMMLCTYEVLPDYQKEHHTSQRQYLWTQYEWGWD